MTVETKQKNEVTTDITISIEEEAYVSMMKYAHMFSPKECSGTGLVERKDFTDGSVEFIVKKVYLPNQTNTGSTTDIEDEEMAKVNTQIVMDGDDTSLHKFHWHSHVDMSVFHSGTDDSNYDDMQTGDYAISLVVNKQYNMLGSVHLYNPLRINVLNVEVEAPDVDLAEYEVPTDLQDILDANVARVRLYEEEASRTRNIGWKNNNRQSGYVYGDYYNSSFGMATGLANDPDFLALLKAGEEQGLIQLVEDTIDSEIIGYINMRTSEYYELSSCLDYTNYSD